MTPHPDEYRLCSLVHERRANQRSLEAIVCVVSFSIRVNWQIIIQLEGKNIIVCVSSRRYFTVL